MRNKLYLIILLLIFLLQSPLYAFRHGEGLPSVPPDAEFHKLQQKVLSLSLIQHLKLTAEQRSQLKQLLTPIQADIMALEKAENYFLNTVLKNRLKDTVKRLENGESASPQKEEIMAQHRSIRTLKRGLFEKSTKIMPQIMDILTSEQKSLFESFDPKNLFELRPPHHKFGLLQMPPEELIMHIRNMPQENFDDIMEHMDRRMAKKSGQGKRKQMKLIRHKAARDLMLEIRSMSEEEFSKKVESLQEQMKDLMPQGKNRYGKKFKEDKDDEKKANEFFKKTIFFTNAFYEAL